MFFGRTLGEGESKGSLYTHTCPSCGGTIQDSLDIKCAFCGSLLNNPKHEWIVLDIMGIGEYREYFQQQAKELDVKVSPALLDSLLEVKDYALNNVMVMIGADGVFAEEEKRFAETMARKWGFNTSRIRPLFDLAKGNRLSIKMPSDPKKRKVIYQLMEKAAEADHDVCEEEKMVLDFVREHFLAAG
jgi:hypothetical protein